MKTLRIISATAALSMALVALTSSINPTAAQTISTSTTAAKIKPGPGPVVGAGLPALAVGVVKAAVNCHNGMATFAEAGVAGKEE